MVLAAAGFVVAGTLSVAHTINKLVPCGQSSGCGIVANDPSSFLFGVPVAYFGVAGYLAILGLSLWRSLSLRPLRPAKLALGFARFGALASGWLTWHSITVLHATCVWCLMSATLMAALLVLSSLAVRIPTATLSRRSGFALAVALSVSAVGSLGVTSRSLQPPTLSMVLGRVSFTDLVPQGAPIRGAADSPVTIVEFADLNCSACREMHGRLTKLIAHHPGRVCLVFRHLPLSELDGHETSARAAVLACIAGRRDRFWQFVDLVYEDSNRMDQPELDRLFTLATEQKVDDQPVRAAEASAQETVRRDTRYAARLGLRQTPTYIVLLNKRVMGVATSLGLQRTLETPSILEALTASGAQK